MNSTLPLPDPVEIATSLLTKTAQTRPPVELGRIIRLWPELDLHECRLDREGYLIDIGRLGAEILVRTDDPPARRRYTIAHELGHWVLQSSGIRKSKHNLAHHVIEKWCDLFAANLLMPREWLARDLSGKKPDTYLTLALSATEKYQVSNEALQLRISELTHMSIFHFKQDEKGLHIQKKFLSSCVDSQRLSRTLQRVSSILSLRLHPGRFKHRDTQMISIHKLMYSRPTERRWLVGIVPLAGQGG